MTTHREGRGAGVAYRPADRGNNRGVSPGHDLNTESFHHDAEAILIDDPTRPNDMCAHNFSLRAGYAAIST